MKIRQSMCPYIADHPYGILIIEGSRKKTLFKTNLLLNSINNQPDIDKIYVYVKIHMKENIKI